MEKNKKIRIDKFLADREIGSRSQCGDMIRKGRVTVNQETIRSVDYKVAQEDQIMVDGMALTGTNLRYYVMNKPAGVISATKDPHQQTVMDLIPMGFRIKGLSPVGRLDKDTVGLLLLTNDGALNHRLLSPNHHIEKTYEVHCAHPLSNYDIEALETGVDIGDGITAPARVEIVDEKVLHLTITEGKFHQVKRMLKAVSNEVLYLKRLKMGNLYLDEALKEGMVRELTKVEKMLLGIKAIIFDLDGTMVDSMGMWKKLDVEYLGKYGIAIPEGLQEVLSGMSFHETADYFMSNFPIPQTKKEMEDTWEEMAYEAYSKKLVLKPGIREFLDKCKDLGIVFGIASSNSRYLIDAFLHGAGIADYFSVIHSGDEHFPGKPNPAIYQAVMEDLGVSPGHCLVFEDIPAGIEAGKKAGAITCAVNDTFSEEQWECKKQLADYWIDSYIELL